MNIKLSFIHFTTDKPYPINIFEHDFTGMINLEDYVAPTTLDTWLWDETKYIQTTTNIMYLINFTALTISWDGKLD